MAKDRLEEVGEDILRLSRPRGGMMASICMFGRVVVPRGAVGPGHVRRRPMGGVGLEPRGADRKDLRRGNGDA